jgi:hypothetical protein
MLPWTPCQASFNGPSQAQPRQAPPQWLPLCKPHKLTANVKAARRRVRRESLDFERAADEEAEEIAAEHIRSGTADHKEDGTEALERLGIVVPLRGFEPRFPD